MKHRKKRERALEVKPVNFSQLQKEKRVILKLKQRNDRVKMMKRGIITEMVLREIARKEKIFLNDLYQYLDSLFKRDFLKDERFSRKQISNAFYTAVRKKYINIDKRFHRVEISLTKKGKRRIERYNQGIFARDIIQNLKKEELASSFTGF